MVSGLRILVAALLAGLATGAAPARAGDGHTGWSITLYGGPASYSRTSDIFQGLGHINGGMIGLAVDKDLVNLGWDTSIAAEGQVGEYMFDHYYGVGSIGLGLRFHHFIWDNTSLAIYSGPSYAVDPPKFRRYKYGGSFTRKRFLNYIGVEFTVAIPHHERHWDAVMRIYHRSGAWGVYSKDVDEGSMIGFGLRAKF